MRGALTRIYGVTYGPELWLEHPVIAPPTQVQAGPQTHCVAQDDLELTLLLPPPESWGPHNTTTGL